MPSAAAVPRAVMSCEIAGRRVVRTIASCAIGLIISVDPPCPGVFGREAEQSGGSDRRMSGIGGKITGKEAVGRKVALVVAAIIVPGVVV